MQALMKKLLVPLIVLAVAVSAAAAGGKTYLGGCTNFERAQFKPKHVFLFCDGAFYVDHIKWKKWGRHRARGRGRAHSSDCNPNCAQGNFRTDRVRLTADRPSRCPGRRKRQFLRLTVTFVKKPPKVPHRTQHLGRICAK